MAGDSTNTDQTETVHKGLSDAIGLFIRGMAMGAADVVPGVSGGTIAFITGIYARFINALRSLSPAFLGELFRGRISGTITQLKRMHWGVLIPVGLGVGVAIVGLSKIITGLMTDTPGPTYAFFTTLASAWIPLAHEDKTAVHFGMGGMAVLMAVVGLQPDGTPASANRAEAQRRWVLGTWTTR